MCEPFATSGDFVAFTRPIIHDPTKVEFGDR